MPIVEKIWEPQPPGLLIVYPGLYRDNFAIKLWSALFWLRMNSSDVLVYLTFAVINRRNFVTGVAFQESFFFPHGINVNISVSWYGLRSIFIMVTEYCFTWWCASVQMNRYTPKIRSKALFEVTAKHWYVSAILHGVACKKIAVV